jgi:hypothetical protein
MPYVLLSLGVVLFLFSIKLTRVVALVGRSFADARRAALVRAAPDLDADAKEAAARAAALGMFGAFFHITLRVLFALGLPAALIAGMAAAGVVDGTALKAAITNWYFIIGSTIVMLAFWKVLK